MAAMTEPSPFEEEFPKSGPHKFRPLRLWDARPNGRCLHCLLPANAHPVHCWVPSRALHDKRKAEVTWEALNG